jgi:hypothetical protein
MVKKIFFTALSLTIVLTFASCKQLDVVGNISVSSFGKIIDAIPDKITEDTSNVSWSLAAPDGSARFLWSRDFSKSPLYDVIIELDAKPFIDAGLDVGKLPEGMFQNDKIVVGTDLGNESLTYNGDVTPLESYKQIVDLKRESVSYHAALDHYGVSLGNGNAFEWAKDKGKSDLDIVFVLNPQVFIDAGVDQTQVKGWAFAKVDTMDMDGKPIQVDKFLKPFDLK